MKNEKNPIVFLLTLLLACAFLMINFVKENEKKQVAAEKNNNNFHFIKEKALKIVLILQKENIIHILMKLTKVKLLINPVDRNDC